MRFPMDRGRFAAGQTLRQIAETAEDKVAQAPRDAQKPRRDNETAICGQGRVQGPGEDASS